ncbi:SHIRT domain-containing protein [Gardnerella pickettii]|uniref:SHIRT domain-containing protein n=1 Tax=Gardnerella pickettii TaxID=2914924 RepID=UPI0039EEA9FC
MTKKTRIVVDFNAGLKHKVNYNFKSEDGKNLPDKVTNLLPKNEKTYKKGEKITPADPTQKEISVDGGKWTFLGYDSKEQTVEDKDLTFTGTWKFTSIKPLSTLDEAPQLEVADKEIMVGETLDLKTLIIKATDKEDGDLKEKVEIVDKGGFDNNKVGTYKITYKVADSKGATATKQATVTVKEKTKSNPQPEPEQEQEQQSQPQSQQQPESQLQSEPKTELQSDTQPQSQPQPKPETQPQHKAALPRTGTTVSSLVLMGSVLVAMGVLLQVSKRKD